MRLRWCLGWCFLALVFASSGLPGSARAERPEGTGIEAGLRVGYSVALGKATGDSADDLSRVVSGQLPLWIDLGYRVIPQLFVGAFAQYGFGFLGGDFDMACSSSGVSCSSSDVRLGLEVHYHPAPQHTVDPFVGLGFGYEWLSISAERSGVSASGTIHGFELLNLQAGIDFVATEGLHLGPALSFALSQYDSVSADCSANANCLPLSNASGSVPNKALHEWFMFALRGAYAP